VFKFKLRYYKDSYYLPIKTAKMIRHVLFTLSPVGVSSIAMNMSVCLSVRSHVSKAASSTCPNFTKFSVRVNLAVARSSSDDTAIRYVLPVF